MLCPVAVVRLGVSLCGEKTEKTCFVALDAAAVIVCLCVCVFGYLCICVFVCVVPGRCSQTRGEKTEKTCLWLMLLLLLLPPVCTGQPSAGCCQVVEPR